MMKVLTGIVAKNLSQLVERQHLLPQTHFGGRPGRTTTDAIHYLIDRIKGAWRKDSVASILFLDVEGAFPNAVTDRLIHNLKRRRFPSVYIHFIEQLLTGRRTKLKFDDFISESMNILNGIGQGDPLSMILYIIYNADLLEIIGDEDDEDALGYVDDVALVAVGKDFVETTEKIERMMTREKGGLQWSRDHNSRFETSKSIILHASRKTRPDPENEGRRISLARPVLVIEGKEIKEVVSFKYLGVRMDNQLSWKEQAHASNANVTKWLLQYKQLTQPSTGVSSKLMRQLYLSVAIPKLTYGVDVWYTPPHKPVGATKNSGTVGVLKILQKTQRLATISIMGAFRLTPTDLLDMHAGVLPMELVLRKACHRAIVRMLTLPDSHPLYQIIRKAKLTPPNKHLSPINQLISIFKLRRKTIETITPLTKACRNRFTTEIAVSRKDSIAQEVKDDADFKIFSDGSGQDGYVGASAVIYRKGVRRPVGHLKAHLGPSTKHTTYEGEVVGDILGLWLASNTPGTVAKQISLYTDNQSLVPLSRIQDQAQANTWSRKHEQR
jgi:hypothetical protein